ncbi:MAG: transporter substrate-binding domain-containing protein [Lachnospiraceae bacterium]|nr:transporter substrate-binding domain-containing protein [Lachnospiraceae bacterium]MBR1523284.1 transporter substrate-binding domain-containing protein [Lachnospiraceae bacterium]
MKKIISLILAGAMTAALVTGCGSTQSDSNAAASDVASETLSDGVLTVGTNAEFPPFEYVGDNGQPDGFDIALIKAIGEELGVEVVIENMEFDSLVSSIGSKTDVAIAGMTVTEERQQSVDFSEPYYNAVQHVLIPADSTIATYDDLLGKTIGCQLGTTGDFIIEEIEGATDQQYNKAVDAVNDLVNGRLDAVIVDSNPAGVFAANFPDQIKDLNGEDFGFGIEEYAIALPKGDTALKEAIDVAITNMKEDGTFDKLVDEYME